MKRLAVFTLCIIMVFPVFFTCLAEQSLAPYQLQMDEFVERYNVYNICTNALIQKKYTPVKATLKKPDGQGQAAFSIKDRKSLIEGYLDGEMVSSLQVTLKSADLLYILSIIGAFSPQGYAAGMVQPRDRSEIFNQFEMMKASFDQGLVFEMNGYEFKEIQRDKYGTVKEFTVTWLNGN